MVKKTILLFFMNCLYFFTNASENKPYTLYWEKTFAPEQLESFGYGMGHPNQGSRLKAREYVIQKNYKSILDIPCGPGIDFLGYKTNNFDIDYTGIDITPKIVNHCKTLGLKAILGSIEQIPFPNRSFDVCYSRHILEHLPNYRKAISELIRTAKKEVIIIFFLPPGNNPDNIFWYTDNNGNSYYQNDYNKQNLDDYINQNALVKGTLWEPCESICWNQTIQESILHIFLDTNS